MKMYEEKGTVPFRIERPLSTLQPYDINNTISIFHRENWGTEKFSSFHWVTQPVHDIAYTETKVMDLFSIYSY